MCIISARVLKSRKFRKCVTCHKVIEPGQHYLRLFGMAFSSDHPYEIFEHLECVDDISTNPKIAKAFQKARVKGFVNEEQMPLNSFGCGEDGA